MCRSHRADILGATAHFPSHFPPSRFSNPLRHFPSFSGTITRALGQNASIYGKMAVIDFRFRVI